MPRELVSGCGQFSLMHGTTVRFLWQSSADSPWDPSWRTFAVDTEHGSAHHMRFVCFDDDNNVVVGRYDSPVRYKFHREDVCMQTSTTFKAIYKLRKALCHT